MAQPTVMHTLTTSWVQVSVDNAPDCSITMEGNRSTPFVLRIAAAKPADSEAEGHTVVTLGRSAPISGLTAGLKVWARAVTGTARIAAS